MLNTNNDAIKQIFIFQVCVDTSSPFVISLNPLKRSKKKVTDTPSRRSIHTCWGFLGYWEVSRWIFSECDFIWGFIKKGVMSSGTNGSFKFEVPRCQVIVQYCSQLIPTAIWAHNLYPVGFNKKWQAQFSSKWGKTKNGQNMNKGPLKGCWTRVVRMPLYLLHCPTHSGHTLKLNQKCCLFLCETCKSNILSYLKAE